MTLKTGINNKPKVFVTRKLPEVVREELIRYVEAEIWDFETPPPYDVILEKVRGKDGLLCLLTDRIDANVLSRNSTESNFPNRLGFDNIDVNEATSRGIRVGRRPVF